MPERARRLVGAARNGLAAARMAGTALGWTAASAALLGAVIAVARGLGADAAGLPLFAAAAALAAAAGAGAALLRRPGEEEAALFVDRALGDRELMSAALYCEKRGMTGPFDGLIGEAAEERAAAELARRGRKFDYGFNRLRIRAALALASLVVGGALVVAAAGIEGRVAGALGGGDRGPGDAFADQASPVSAAASREIARSVFPEDSRLAKAAERALASGRIEDFRELVRKADAELARRIAKSGSALERDRLEKERRALKDAADEAEKQSASLGDEKDAKDAKGPKKDRTRKENGRDRAEGRDDPGKDGPDDRGERRGRDEAQDQGGPGSMALEEGAEQGEEAGMVDQPGDGGNGDGEEKKDEVSGMRLPGGGGDKAGRGEGRLRDFPRMSPRASAETLKLGGSDEDPFEIVLPGGKRAAGPVTAAEAVRSAEAAMSRERVPVEYGDYVRAYYLSIASEEEGAEE